MIIENNIKNVFKTVFVIIGTIIGAGFASGQEIYTFFNRYGINGLIGIFISFFLIGFIIWKTFNIVLKNNINNYNDFISYIMTNKISSTKIAKDSISNIINIFLLISFNIMVAGFATYFMQELNISKWFGAIIIAMLSFITFSKSIEGVIKINTYLIPTLILLIIFLGIKKINHIDLINISVESKSSYWILSSILYTSYNSISLIPILIGLKKYIIRKNEVKLTSIFTVIIMLILSITIFLLLNLFLPEIKRIEIPIIYIANTLGHFFKYVYGIVILIAIFTTAVSSGYGFLSNITKDKKTYNIISFMMCTFSVLVGQMSFSKLVNLLYPIFGYLGIVQIIFLLIKQNNLKNKYRFDINKITK